LLKIYELYTGNKTDRSKVFEAFYDEGLSKSQMIKNAPITHKCKLVKSIDFGDTHYLFIGEIIETYVNENLIPNRKPEMK
jgi:flavin reductase (DIM6/NTAB) family NADH-FMN oxidoreductase RutF